MMDFEIQVIAVPVTDVDRASAFCTRQLDVDYPDGNTWIVQ